MGFRNAARYPCPRARRTSSKAGEQPQSDHRGCFRTGLGEAGVLFFIDWRKELKGVSVSTSGFARARRRNSSSTFISRCSASTACRTRTDGMRSWVGPSERRWKRAGIRTRAAPRSATPVGLREIEAYLELAMEQRHVHYELHHHRHGHLPDVHELEARSVRHHVGGHREENQAQH